MRLNNGGRGREGPNGPVSGGQDDEGRAARVSDDAVCARIGDSVKAYVSVFGPHTCDRLTRSDCSGAVGSELALFRVLASH